MSEVSSRYYTTRSQAAKAAKSTGYGSFQTIKQPAGWKWASMPVPSPALEFAKGKDYVAWVETHHIDEGRTPGHRGVLIVTIPQDELPSDIPVEFDVQPITPSLWANPSETDAQPRTNRVAGQSGQRAKSDVESPVKIVWRVASEMVGASRKDVVEACVALGVNKATASTQYYRWQKASE